MSKINLVSGARLSGGGLHLGHYLGCISPLSSFSPKKYNYYFVIEDVSPSHNLISQSTNIDLIAMASDLLATRYSEHIKVVLQSGINTEGPVLYNTLADLMTLRQIQAVHPQRKRIRSNELDCSLNEFIFILRDVFIYLALNAQHVLMNDDNLRFVRYARRIARKFNKAYEPILNEPTLEHGVRPRLLGYNLQRMAKSNSNCIYLSETKEALIRKCVQITKSKYATHFLKLDTEGRIHPSFDVPDYFLPFTYLRVFGERSRVVEAISSFCSGDLSLDDLSWAVFQTLEGFINPMRPAQTYYRSHPEKVLARLHKDTEHARDVVRKTEKRVIASIRSVYF